LIKTILHEFKIGQIHFDRKPIDKDIGLGVFVVTLSLELEAGKDGHDENEQDTFN